MEKNNFGIPTGVIENERRLAEELVDISSDLSELAKGLSAECGITEEYDGPKVVVYASTRNRYDQMERAAKTLVSNGNVDKIFFFIEDDKFPRPLPDMITTVNISAQNYFKSYCPNSASPWTYMAMIRLALPKILPMYDRILWLDIDTLVVDDISDMFKVPLGDYYYFAAAKENRRYIKFLEIRKIETTEVDFQGHPQIDNQDYYNSGVLLENMKLLRESGMCDRLISRINNFKSYFPDQNIINQLCRNRIYTLPHAYNWSYFTGDTDIPRIIHTSNGQPRYDVQDIINMYDKVAFKQIITDKNKKPFIYNSGNADEDEPVIELELVPEAVNETELEDEPTVLETKPVLTEDPDSEPIEVMEVDEVVETNQDGSVHWN